MEACGEGLETPKKLQVYLVSFIWSSVFATRLIFWIQFPCIFHKDSACSARGRKAPRAAADLVFPQHKGAQDQFFTFQGVTDNYLHLLPFSKRTPGKNSGGSLFPLSGRLKGFQPRAKDRLERETWRLKTSKCPSMKPRYFLKDHSRVVQQEALLQGCQKGSCTVVLISLENGKEKILFSHGLSLCACPHFQEESGRCTN